MVSKASGQNSNNGYNIPVSDMGPALMDMTKPGTACVANAQFDVLQNALNYAKELDLLPHLARAFSVSATQMPQIVDMQFGGGDPFGLRLTGKGNRLCTHSRLSRWTYGDHVYHAAT